jgi:steroid delta-isomerase
VADPDAIRTTIDAYVDHMSRGDKEAWLDLFAPTARVEDPVGSPVREGRAAIGEFFDFAQSLADRLTLERSGPVRVVGHEAAWPMQAFSELGGDRFVVDIIDVMAFDDSISEGKALITSLRAFWDPAEMRPA